MRNDWCQFLPPLAPDYSGACSCVYQLNPLVVIHDAAGCTGNYTGYDEPRWYHHPAPVFCSNLREMDAILGLDIRLKQAIAEQIPLYSPELILLCGSPVPAIIGCDLAGLAKEIEEESGVPALGIPTTGAHHYNHGYGMCFEALLKRVLPERLPAEEAEGGDCAVRLAVMGLSVIDGMDQSYAAWLAEGLAERGLQLLTTGSGETSLRAFERYKDADALLLLSSGAYPAARYWSSLYPERQILARLPLTEADLDYISAYFQKTGVPNFPESMRTGLSEQKHNDPASRSARPGQKRSLIVAEELLADAIARLIRRKGIKTAIDKLVLPEPLHETAGLDYIFADSEKSLRSYLADPSYKYIVGDPLLKCLPELRGRAETVEFWEWPQFALSSHLYEADMHSVKYYADKLMNESAGVSSETPDGD